MAYLALLLGLIRVLMDNTKGMTTNQGLALVLKNAYGIQAALFGVVIIIAALVTIASLALTVLGAKSRSEGGVACGCFGLSGSIGIWVAVGLHWVGLKVLENLSGSIDPTLGVVDPVRFWALAIVLLLVGIT